MVRLNSDVRVSEAPEAFSLDTLARQVSEQVHLLRKVSPLPSPGTSAHIDNTHNTSGDDVSKPNGMTTIPKGFLNSKPVQSTSVEDTLIGPAKDELNKRKANLLRMKETVTGLADALNAVPAILAGGKPFNIYAASHFLDANELTYSNSLPSLVVLRSTTSCSDDVQELAHSAWILLLYYSGHLVLVDGSLRQNDAFQPEVKKRSRLSFRKSSKTDITKSSTKTLKSVNAMAVFDRMGCRSDASNLEMCQQYIKVALQYPEISNELFCQLVKQLTGNPHNEPCSKLWFLLGLCLTCFSPSEDLAVCIATFVRSVPTTTLTQFCDSQITVWLKSRCRKRPPNRLEFQAAKLGVSPEVSIELSDGTASPFVVESRLETLTLCKRVCDRLGLRDSQGWALYISTAALSKPLCINSAYTFMHDAITTVEQQQAGGQSAGGWVVQFRREYFPPWHQPELEPLSSELVYHQVMHLVATSNIFANAESKLIDLLARRYYVHFGPVFDRELMLKTVTTWIPSATAGKRSPDTWCTLIQQRLITATYVTKGLPTAAVVSSVAMFAKTVLAKFFVRRIKGVLLHSNSARNLPQAVVVITINHDSIEVVAAATRARLIKIPFYTIVSAETTERIVASVAIETVAIHCFDADYVFSGDNATFMLEHILGVLSGLRLISRIGVCLSNTNAEFGSLLKCREGDIVVFETAASRSNYSAVVQNLRSAESGEVICDGVFMLATITPPRDMDTTVLAISNQGLRLGRD